MPQAQGAASPAGTNAVAWPIITAERNANIQPSNFNYPPGNVRRYGALGDGNADDTESVSRAIEVVRQIVLDGKWISNAGTSNPHSAHGAALVVPAGIYKVTKTLWLGADSDTGQDYDDQIRNIVGEAGAVIYGVIPNNPVLDFAGADNVRMSNITIFGDPVSTPNVGLLLARSGSASPNSSAGNHKFTNVRIIGHYSVASVYEYGSEINSWANCEMRNAKNGAVSTYYTTSTNGLQQIRSPNTTVAVNSYQSSYGGKFVNTDIRSGANGVPEIRRYFDLSDIDLGSDQISMPNHQYSSGDRVIFTEGNGPIAELLNDSVYFIEKIDANIIKLHSDAKLSAAIDISKSDDSSGHELLRPKSAAIIIESTSFGPRFYLGYFDLLQGASVKKPVVLFQDAPGASPSQKRTQAPSFFGCKVENDYDSFVEVAGHVRELTIKDMSFGGSVGTADIVVTQTGHLLWPDIQTRRGGTTVEPVTYSIDGILRNGEESMDWNPGPVRSGDTVAIEINIVGAELGDFAVASLDHNIKSLLLSAAVTSQNTVTVMLSNNTEKIIDLPPGKLRVRLIK